MYQLSEIEEAAQRLKSIAIKTPLFESLELDKKVGGKIFVKPECIQRTGSFKIRGAYNLMSQLSTKDASNGVVAFSSGNHAQGVALAGQILNIDTTIVIPEDAPSSKIENTIKLGGKVILYDRYRDLHQTGLRVLKWHVAFGERWLRSREKMLRRARP